MFDWYAGRRVLITGGLGFLGRRLAVQLATCGATIVLVDLPQVVATINSTESETLNRVAEIRGVDVCRTEQLAPCLEPADVIFWLAAHGGHLASMRASLLDIDTNYRSVAAAAEVCRSRNPKVRFIFTSTRQVYGRASQKPIDETHRTRPPDINGINKLAAEHLLRLYAEVHGMATVSLRLTNVYGPSMQLDDPEHGVAGVLVGQALRGRPLTLFGGEQRREFLYIDDVTDALLRIGQREQLRGESFNLGADRPHSLREFAEAVVRLVPAELHIVPFPPERRAIDVGDVVCDSTRFRQATGWRPTVDLDTGLQLTIQHFQNKS